MYVTINGKTETLPDNITTVKHLVSYYGLEGKILVVEQNQEIIETSQYQEQILNEHDKIEIVNFVGGG